VAGNDQNPLQMFCVSRELCCLRLMGKKLLVALTMEGKFAGEGLQSIDETMTCFRDGTRTGREKWNWGIRRRRLESSESRASETVSCDFWIKRRCCID
jgi:hypothetical protein